MNNQFNNEELQIKEVDFQGDNLLAIKENRTGKIYVAVKWVCRGLKLSEGQYQNQIRKIQDDIVLSKGIAKMQLPTAGGRQEVVCLELDFLPIWLAKINANIIKSPEVQNKLVEYQLKAKDVLAQAFLRQPMTQIQILQQAVNILAQHEQKLLELEEKQQILQYRVDNLDAINIEGDLQQRLNKLVKKYAFKAGVIFSVAWEHFKQAYNTAYRTNLELLMRNYAEREGIKGLTIPQYLALTGHLEDGIRVADKMLNDIKTA